MWPVMVDEIARILIDPLKNDKVVWKYSENGKFSTKSAYLAITGYFEPPDSHSSKDNQEWNTLVWNLNIPPKVKVFMWKFVADILHTPVNIMKKEFCIIHGVCDVKTLGYGEPRSFLLHRG